MLPDPYRFSRIHGCLTWRGCHQLHPPELYRHNHTSTKHHDSPTCPLPGRLPPQALPYHISSAQWVMPGGSFTGIWCRHLNSRAVALTKTQWTCQQSILPSKVFPCAVNGSKMHSLDKIEILPWRKGTLWRDTFILTCPAFSWKAVKALAFFLTTIQTQFH